ncbi:lactase-like protein isoform X2 [Epargyreus clarus]
MLRELGVDYYRFSIAWTRILPTGRSHNINEKGVQYYNNLIDELLKYNIQPMVTLYHFDLPQKLQDLGGWTNPLIVGWFEDYARVVFEKFADRVKYWVTVNQPSSCVMAYGEGVIAPGVVFNGVGEYLCIKNMLLAHAAAYRLYEKEYKKKYKGSVGIALELNWSDPINNKTANVEATDRYKQFTLDLYLHPIWSKQGDFPSLVKEVIAKKSREQGFKRSRLPVLSSEEKQMLKGSADFIGINHYTTNLVKPSKAQYIVPSFNDDVGVELSYRKDWMQAKSPWLRSAPYGLYKLCLYINKHYDYPKVFITEHGWSTSQALWDNSRVENLRGYLKALLFAIEDGTEVIGYTAWSLMDNVEWNAGVSERFGLYEVDFDSKEKTRTARLSALVYKRIIEKRIVESDWTPTNLDINISNKEGRVEL